MTEVEAVAAKLGIELPVSIEQRIAGAEKVGEHKTSMLQDLEAGRPMELEAVVGAVVELGERLGVPMPHTRTRLCLHQASGSNLTRRSRKVNRWIRLGAAVIAMMMIANLQYAWTLFVKPIIVARHALEAVRCPVGLHALHRLRNLDHAVLRLADRPARPAHVSDRRGPAVRHRLGRHGPGQHAARSYTRSIRSPDSAPRWSIAARMGIALKWFPDKRGLAAGLIAAGFGSGAALFVPLIAYMIHSQDYRAAFLYTGMRRDC